MLIAYVLRNREKAWLDRLDRDGSADRRSNRRILRSIFPEAVAITFPEEGDVFFGTVSGLEKAVRSLARTPKRKRLCGALALLSLALPMLQAADDKSKADQIRVYVFTAGISDKGIVSKEEVVERATKQRPR
jgi:hypothetical protein